MNLGAPGLRVGIGFAPGQVPGYPLSFPSATGDKISLWGAARPSTAHYGLGIQESQFQLFVPTTDDNIVFGIGSSTNFTENVRFTGDGKVGIGTINPASPLTIKPATSSIGLDHTSSNGNVRIGTFVSSSVFGDIARIQTHSNHALGFATNNGAARMTISTDGNVGIGDGSPTLGGLVVDKKVGATNAVFGSNTFGVAIETDYPGVGFNSYFNNGRKALRPGFGGLIGQDPNTGRIYIQNTPTSASAANADMTALERVSILPNGNVGIGINNPVSLLTLKSGTTSGVGLDHISSDGTVRVGTFATGEAGAFIQTHSSHSLNFATNNGAARITIATNGNVGVRTTDPQAGLHVSGTMRLVTGDQGEGKVLTSNANGDATWQKAGYGAVSLTVTPSERDLTTTITSLTGLVEALDDDGRFSNSQYIVGTAGYYMITGSLLADLNMISGPFGGTYFYSVSNRRYNVHVMVNNNLTRSSTPGKHYCKNNGNSDDDDFNEMPTILNTVIKCNVNDVISFGLSADSGPGNSKIDVIRSAQFTITKL